MKEESLVLTPPSALTPVELLRIAVTQGADVDKLGKLMELQEKWEANEAKKAYNTAMRQFKANPPHITKSKAGPKLGNSSEPSYYYTPLEKVCEKLIPALNEVGIRHSWKTRYEGEWAIVTCRLTHELGYFEEAEQRGCDDKGPGRNAIQAGASTVTYLQRYTLLAVCGLATRGMDNDAQSVNQPDPMPDERLIECQDWLRNCRTEAELKKMFATVYKEASEFGDKDAMASLIAVKDKKKKELQNAAS